MAGVSRKLFFLLHRVAGRVARLDWVWGGSGTGKGAVPPPQRNFFFNFQVKNAGFCAFYCKKTTCDQTPGPRGGGLIDSGTELMYNARGQVTI